MLLTNCLLTASYVIKSDSGRKSLVQAVGIAALGAWARRSLPSTKLGGTKFYFRIWKVKTMASLSIIRTGTGATINDSYSSLSANLRLEPQLVVLLSPTWGISNQTHIG